MGVEQIAFHVTDRCQLDCQHCLRDPAQSPTDLSVALIERVLDEVRTLHGTTHVALTGGEPTLHPEFVRILDAIGARDMNWHMVTNGRNFGWLLTQFAGRPDRRAALARVYFSLDGVDEQTHDAIRGAGSFREVMTACALAQAHEVPFVLQMVMNARNQHQVEALGLMAAQLGASRVQYCFLQPTGTHHDRALALSPSAWRALADRVNRVAETLRIEVGMPEGWPETQPFRVCEPFQSKTLHVDVQGRLNLCCQHAGIPHAPNAPSGESDVVANLDETSLVDGHLRMLGLVHRVQTARLSHLAKGQASEWDAFPCNWCLGHFGKPHWTDEGAKGPEAARERWVGAWGAPKDQAPRARLPIVK